MARVFVSYSRKNIDFCKRLAGELQKREFDLWVDWEDIPPTVDWMKEIQKGIEEADTFIFIVSPESIASKVCKDELELAAQNGKRLIPVVPFEIKWDDVPSVLSHLNYIFFRENDDFDAALTKLLTALNTDYDWLQTQRRLQVKALEWDRGNKDSGFLLRGRDLEEGEQQLSINVYKDPHPTDIQREYVLKSRQATNRQRRITIGVLIFIIGMMVGVIAALVTPGILNILARSRARSEMGDMVSIPAGDTIFGTDNPENIEFGFVPRRSIYLPAFQIGKYEVTNYQYGLCVDYGNCTVPANQSDFRDESKQKHPVVTVTLYQASNYCRWLGHRLPTSAEWETGRTGPNGYAWPWGNDPIKPEFVTVDGGTQPVDSKPAGASNPEGVYNLIGNVWEWTSSYKYDKDSNYDVTQFWDGEPQTYKGTDKFITRGGGWEFYYDDDVAEDITWSGVYADGELGIRCAADLP